MKTKKLYETNMDVVLATLSSLNNSGIKEFETRNLFYKFIEEIKFPYTINWRKPSYIWSSNSYHRKPYYMPNNYQPVEAWLLDRGIITIVETIRGTKQLVYKYQVNHGKMANVDFSPKYTTS
jgi:hypothetical protein